ncbi:MAG: D-cysteine desulfhydrase family protein [Anaerolineae bacterium]|nr:D-cysteine desulfhydrase family protein [Anaerolineae bacterium]
MIPRVKIAHLPTPLESMPRLSAFLKDVRLWIKRDDLTGLAFGGNKTRKLELLLADAQSQGARTLVTVGAAQSNHCRLTAAVAAKFGMDCILVLSGDPQQAGNGNFLLDELFGAELVWTEKSIRDETLHQVYLKAWEDGRRPYKIPLGASTPLGTLGYYFAFEELSAQSDEFDWIVVASSSAGTQAGLILGAHAAGWSGRILGISIDHPRAALRATIADLVHGASDWVNSPVQVDDSAIIVNDDYLGAGYGVPSLLEFEAMHLFARYEGIVLDPVYTGRSAGAMIDLVRKGFFKKGERILFWHTGGAPSLFAQQYAPLLKGS